MDFKTLGEYNKATVDAFIDKANDIYTERGRCDEDCLLCPIPEYCHLNYIDVALKAKEFVDYVINSRRNR